MGAVHADGGRDEGQLLRDHIRGLAPVPRAGEAGRNRVVVRVRNISSVGPVIDDHGNARDAVGQALLLDSFNQVLLLVQGLPHLLKIPLREAPFFRDRGVELLLRVVFKKLLSSGSLSSCSFKRTSFFKNF